MTSPNSAGTSMISRLLHPDELVIGRVASEIDFLRPAPYLQMP
jgi:hypothetical protein